MKMFKVRAYGEEFVIEVNEKDIDYFVTKMNQDWLSFVGVESVPGHCISISFEDYLTGK